MLIFFARSTNTFSAFVTDEAGHPVNDAIVTMTVEDELGQEVAGETWPVTMASTGAGGKYVYQPPTSVDLEIGARYWVPTLAVRGALQRYARPPLKVVIDET